MRGRKKGAKKTLGQRDGRGTRASPGGRHSAVKRRLAEALEQQAATSEVLRVISRSPSDLRPVFETVLSCATDLCAGNMAVLWRFDGTHLRIAAQRNTTPARLAYLEAHPLVLGSYNPTPRAGLERRIVHERDVFANPEYRALIPHDGGGRPRSSTVIAVPLLREAQLLGVITVWRRQKKQFTKRQVALLSTLAEQAVIAIENVRLFNETKEALEQQTATSEILRVMSRSPTDVQPVFDTIAKAALKLCGGTSATVVTFDGSLVSLAAIASFRPEEGEVLRRLYPRPPSRATVASRAVLTCDIVSIPNVQEDADYQIRDVARSAGFWSALGVPLLRGGRPIGAIGVGRPEVGPFADKQVALLQTFADQAVIAIENVRLFTELEARTTELTRSVQELKALGEVGQAVSSTLDLETVLSTITSRATQLASMDGGAIHEYDEARREFHLRTSSGLPDELVVALQAEPINEGEGAVGRMAATREAAYFRDIVDEGGYHSRVRGMLVRHGYRSLLAVPLLREDHLLGGLVMFRKTTGVFAPQIIDLLRSFATQSALAIHNARLYREIELKSRQLETASKHKSEFLANMSHELRTPLNAILGFSEVLSERMFGDVNDKQAEYLSDIMQSGQHLLSLINDILDLSKIEAGRMELELGDFDLASTIQSMLMLIRERADRRGIVLGRRVDGALGVVRADERKIKQVLLNLLSNALKFTPEGGQISVGAAVHDGLAEISISDTGVGISPADQVTLFEAFRQVGTSSSKIEGTGLGLAISRKFVELHGGTISVKSQVGSGSTFSFTLPVQHAVMR